MLGHKMLFYVSSLPTNPTPSCLERLGTSQGLRLRSSVRWASSFKPPLANNVLNAIRWVCRKQMEVELGQVVRKYTEEKEKNDEVRPPANALVCSQVLGIHGLENKGFLLLSLSSSASEISPTLFRFRVLFEIGYSPPMLFTAAVLPLRFCLSSKTCAGCKPVLQISRPLLSGFKFSPLFCLPAFQKQ